MESKRSLKVVLAALVLIVVAQVTAYGQTAGVLTIQDDKVKVGGDNTAADAPIEIVGEAGTIGIGNSVALLRRAGALGFQLDDTSVAGYWQFANAAGETEFRISRQGTGVVEMTLTSAGNLTITGNLTTAGGMYPDYVFEKDYELMDLNELESFISENKHLPNVPPASEMKESVNVNELQRVLLEKVEELTLYTIAQQKTIEELQARLDAQEQGSKN